MSAKISQRLYGAMLFVGVVTAAAAPAHAQSFRYGQSDPSAPVYRSSDTDDQMSSALPRPELQRQVVSYSGSEPVGTIIIDPAHTFLYLTLGGGTAMRYGIGVGREGFVWSGVEKITRKAEWPDWTPPPEMVARQPYLPLARCISATPITASMAPTIRAPSDSTCRAVAFVCATRMWKTSTAASGSEPK
jgi:lipoprotein-anchoring transpeptidase ErfK/SrfK